MKLARLPIAMSSLVLAACGGGVEDVAEIADASATPGPTDASAIVLVGVTGTVSRISGSWPGPPSISPVARRVVLVKPGGRFSPRDPRLSDAQIAADVWSSADGAFVIAAPPGDYFLFAVSEGERLANDRDNYAGLDGGDIDVRLELGRPVRRQLVINGYID